MRVLLTWLGSAGVTVVSSGSTSLSLLSSPPTSSYHRFSILTNAKSLLAWPWSYVPNWWAPRNFSSGLMTIGWSSCASLVSTPSVFLAMMSQDGSTSMRAVASLSHFPGWPCPLVNGSFWMLYDVPSPICSSTRYGPLVLIISLADMQYATF
jgi:hypothetical protein